LCAIGRSCAWQARFGPDAELNEQSRYQWNQRGWRVARRFSQRRQAPQSPPRKPTRPDDDDCHGLYESFLARPAGGCKDAHCAGVLVLLPLPFFGFASYAPSPLRLSTIVPFCTGGVFLEAGRPSPPGSLPLRWEAVRGNPKQMGPQSRGKPQTCRSPLFRDSGRNRFLLLPSGRSQWSRPASLEGAPVSQYRRRPGF